MPQQFSDHNTDKAFREKLSGLRVEPRSRVWYRVSAGLDREGALVAHKKRRVIGALIGIILLTGIILTAVLDPVATRKKISSTNGEINDFRQVMENNGISFPESSIAEEDESVNSIFNNENSTAKNVEPSLVELNNVESAIQKTETRAGNTNSILNLQMINSFVNFENQNAIASIKDNSIQMLISSVLGDDENYSSDCNCNDKLYVGANFKLNRTSFADTALSQNSNFIDKFHLKKGVSVYAGYRFNKKICAELGWNILSNEGQSYGYTSLSRKPGAKPTRHDYEIALRYTQIPVKIRYSVDTWSGILKTNVSYSLAIGAMYGKLLKSEYTIGEMDISSKLKKSEVAAIGNLSVDVKIYKHLSFSTGMEASYSNDIFETGKRISPFSAPHNLIIGATAGLKYNFCRK